MKPTWIFKPYPQLTLTELYALLSLRQEVFVVEQNCPYLDTDGKDFAAWHLMGYAGGALVAYTRLLPKGVSYPHEASIGRVATSPAARGGGLGRLLMEESLTRLEALFGSRANRIGAQCYLIKFYESLGYVVAGERYLEDGICHVEMVYAKA